ncbi:MAG: RNA-binding transcriptional accessory protein [Tenericutes bacterium]|nr:RNA-binding transcriptional accessory protein [Mycoplasmatota bacterium]
MNEIIIKEIANQLNIRSEQVLAVLSMLEEGNTIPFIARYRKEKTGALDEEQIKTINEYYEYQVNLLKRKEDVIRLIDEKGLMTDELREKIMSANKLVEVEDLYRPYKEKKKTKATEAIKAGLEPLAKMILSFPIKGSIEELSKKFINDNIKNVDEAVTGASYIIAEYISDNAYYRKSIRNTTYRMGTLVCKLKKDANDPKKVYEMYYDYKEQVKNLKPHRVLAINRAENEKIITVNIDVDVENILGYLESKIIKNKESFIVNIVKDAIKDSYKRLIAPSIEREIRSDLTEIAHEAAIENFSKNLESLLLTPPMKEKVVLAFDPGFVNGCKLAVIDKKGKYLESLIVKPFMNNINTTQLNTIKAQIMMLIKKYNVDIVSIGNGTASRESEKLISEIIKEYKLNCKYVIVSEAGASIYSTEKVAQEEFPDLSPNERSAVSIGRRLQDPLSELVKIPPDGIGVGLYQHDVKGKKLNDSLDFVVTKAVNSVGVNINTASPSLLKYVSGITKKNIEKIIDYRENNGRINSREEIKKKKLLSDKVYEQAIGFLRITDGINPLDQTGIHPESYDIATNLLKKLDFTIKDLGSEKLINKINTYDIENLAKELNTDIYTLEDIVKSLKSPMLDPRDEMPQPLLKSDVLDIKDLKRGMKLQGTVRNVIDFGAFIDIGLHNDGLAHISKLTKKYIKHPSKILSVGDIVDCYVDEVNVEKEKVNLSLIDPNEK